MPNKPDTVYRPNIHSTARDAGPDLTDAIAAAGKTPRYYRPELDALRFFAFLCVFITHRNDLAPIDPVANPWYHAVTMSGVFGLPVFFLLSAFFITELLQREVAATGRVDARAFYIRRILRIWPLYFLVFFGLAALNLVVPGAGANSPAEIFSFVAFAGNWFITFNGWTIEYPVIPLWSLSVEEQFYVAIPLLAALSRRHLVAVNIAVLVVAYAVIMRPGLARHNRSVDSGRTASCSFSSLQVVCCCRSAFAGDSRTGRWSSELFCLRQWSACG
jgi:peptidoglycan/LPS O-acetylase OafA/YrhL